MRRPRIFEICDKQSTLIYSDEVNGTVSALNSECVINYYFLFGEYINGMDSNRLSFENFIQNIH